MGTEERHPHDIDLRGEEKGLGLSALTGVVTQGQSPVGPRRGVFVDPRVVTVVTLSPSSSSVPPNDPGGVVRSLEGRGEWSSTDTRKPERHVPTS